MVAGGQGFLQRRTATDHLAVVQKQAHGFTRRCIEGDFDLQPFFRANGLHALERRGLGADGEIQPPAIAKIQQRTAQAIGFERGVTLHQSHHAQGFCVKQKPPGDDGVTTNVIQGTATVLRFVANVAGILVVVAEGHLHGAQIAQLPRAHQLTRP